MAMMNPPKNNSVTDFYKPPTESSGAFLLTVVCYFACIKQQRMHSRVQQYVQQLQLHPHPEGGFYKQTYASSEQVAANALPERFAASRRFSTAIYFC